MVYANVITKTTTTATSLILIQISWPNQPCMFQPFSHNMAHKTFMKMISSLREVEKMLHIMLDDMSHVTLWYSSIVSIPSHSIPHHLLGHIKWGLHIRILLLKANVFPSDCYHLKSQKPKLSLWHSNFSRTFWKFSQGWKDVLND